MKSDPQNFEFHIDIQQQNEYWPLISTVAANGYAGLNIMPRWGEHYLPAFHNEELMNITATTIYYNCDLPACTLQEWINTSGGSGDFNNLLNDARVTNTRHLLALHRQYLH
jgi:hypothetical protein